MYFNIACLEEPPLSFRLLIAACTISMYLGWLAGVFGLVDFFFGDLGATGAAAAGAGAVAVSAIVQMMCRSD
jgi:hypothetical protein